eukprot:3445991-Amphidinium_carterae.1
MRLTSTSLDSNFLADDVNERLDFVHIGLGILAELVLSITRMFGQGLCVEDGFPRSITWTSERSTHCQA